MATSFGVMKIPFSMYHTSMKIRAVAYLSRRQNFKTNTSFLILNRKSNHPTTPTPRLPLQLLQQTNLFSHDATTKDGETKVTDASNDEGQKSCSKEEENLKSEEKATTYNKVVPIRPPSDSLNPTRLNSVPSCPILCPMCHGHIGYCCEDTAVKDIISLNPKYSTKCETEINKTENVFTGMDNDLKGKKDEFIKVMPKFGPHIPLSSVKNSDSVTDSSRLILCPMCHKHILKRSRTTEKRLYHDMIPFSVEQSEILSFVAKMNKTIFTDATIKAVKGESDKVTPKCSEACPPCPPCPSRLPHPCSSTDTTLKAVKGKKKANKKCPVKCKPRPCDCSPCPTSTKATQQAVKINYNKILPKCPGMCAPRRSECPPCPPSTGATLQTVQGNYKKVIPKCPRKDMPKSPCVCPPCPCYCPPSSCPYPPSPCRCSPCPCQCSPCPCQCSPCPCRCSPCPCQCSPYPCQCSPCPCQCPPCPVDITVQAPQPKYGKVIPKCPKTCPPCPYCKVIPKCPETCPPCPYYCPPCPCYYPTCPSCPSYSCCSTEAKEETIKYNKVKPKCPVTCPPCPSCCPPSPCYYPSYPYYYEPCPYPLCPCPNPSCSCQNPSPCTKPQCPPCHYPPWLSNSLYLCCLNDVTVVAEKKSYNKVVPKCPGSGTSSSSGSPCPKSPSSPPCPCDPCKPTCPSSPTSPSCPSCPPCPSCPSVPSKC